MNEYQASARRLRALMDAVPITVPELARTIGSVESTIYHWLKGIRLPSRRYQPRLAKALRVSRAQINGFER